ncbi:MAG: hypothetical protein ACRD8A_13550 [Candidatus Acidiferrales bacterium]
MRSYRYMKPNASWVVLVSFAALIFLRPQVAASQTTLLENGVRSGQDAPAQNQNPQPDVNRSASDDSELITLPAGTAIPVRLADEVNSHHDKRGELYTGSVDPSVLIQDRVVIPRGTEAHVRLVRVKKGGRLHGKAKVQLELVSLIMNGEKLGVNTEEEVKKEGTVHAKASAEAKKGPQGAGALAGHPEDVAGPVIAVFAAPKIDIKAESRIEFTLDTPFTFKPVPSESNQQ